MKLFCAGKLSGLTRMLDASFHAQLWFFADLVLFSLVFNGLSPWFDVSLTFHIPARPIFLPFSVFFVLVLSL
ncbi:unnamed protein product [Gulo gulo]|uniref:Uncharacterized protein n=1 Tax=Gulo gulo TaxID=48420 RepID=A0A9X9QAR1_GULGU|nr:unnamed protein product [Gulo gulo]